MVQEQVELEDAYLYSVNPNRAVIVTAARLNLPGRNRDFRALRGGCEGAEFACPDILGFLADCQ